MSVKLWFRQVSFVYLKSAWIFLLRLNFILFRQYNWQIVTLKVNKDYLSMLGPRLLSFLFDFGCLEKMNEKRDFGFLLGYFISKKNKCLKIYWKSLPFPWKSKIISNDIRSKFLFNSYRGVLISDWVVYQIVIEWVFIIAWCWLEQLQSAYLWDTGLTSVTVVTLFSKKVNNPDNKNSGLKTRKDAALEVFITENIS